MLLAVAILGVGVVILVGGMMTSIKVSGQGRVAAEGQSALRAYAEAVSCGRLRRLRRAATPPRASPPRPAGSSPPQSVSYWDGSTFGSTCSTDLGLQKVALTLTADDGSVESLSIAKRAP